MKLELVTRTDVSFVELLKDEKECLGITIKVAGPGEAGPVISKVKPRSTAERSFSLAEGDAILFLNERSTTRKGSKDIRRMLKDAGSSLGLQIQYALREIRISSDGTYRRQLLTIVLQKERGSFGFVLRKKGSFCAECPRISNIKEGSHAQKSGQLQEGDRLLKVDNLSLSCLSLAEVACILQNRDRAEFTFEYGIRVVNFDDRSAEITASNCRLDLEIDVPVSDLGVSLNTDESTQMHVGSIRRGSIAERCGVLSQGDVILSINDVETKFLTLSRADFLLRNSKQIRKITFVSSKQRESDVAPINEDSLDTRPEDDSSTVYSGAETTVWKHLNTTTPASSVQHKHRSAYCQSEDIKAVDKFQHLASMMIRLKRVLSLLTREAYTKENNTLSQNCTVCDKTRHSVKLCASCVANINVDCAQSINSLRDAIAHFVDFTTNPKVSYQGGALREPSEDHLIKHSTKNLVLALKEKLSHVFDSVPEMEEFFKVLDEKIERAETTCRTCNFDTKSVMVTVKKFLLLESLGDDSLESKRLLEILKRRLLETNFICDFEADEYICVETGEDGCLSTSENFSLNSLSGIEGRATSPNEGFHENNSDSSARRTRTCEETCYNITHLDSSTNRDYLKIAHVENSTTGENSVDEEEKVEEMNYCCKSASEQSATENEGKTTAEIALLSINSEDSGDKKCKKMNKVKNFKLSHKVRRSLDSFFNPKSAAATLKAVPVECQSTPIENNKNCQEMICMSSINDDSRRASAHPNNTELERSARGSRRNSTTTPSSFRSTSKTTSLDGFHNTLTEIMEVKLRNEGAGFGLGLILKTASDKRPVFIVSAIRPKSPSQKIGVLKEEDRIVAINHQRTSGLSTKELSSLKTAAFSAETVTLTVEFDVMDKPKKFGTFDVHLNKKPKPGLFFSERKAGQPMVVSGVLKGGMAHRCGQIFNGDKISFFRLTKVEKFDPVTGIQSRENKLILTVQRDPPEVAQQQPPETVTTASYFNPCFHCEDDVPRNGTSFIVKKSAVRAVRNVDALVLDQEVTLFRDPVLGDFGMLVGENPDTGRAYVTDIRTDGPAYQSGIVKRFDRIVQVNSIRVDKNMEDSILGLLSQADHKVDLLIRRMYHEETTRL